MPDIKSGFFSSLLLSLFSSSKFFALFLFRNIESLEIFYLIVLVDTPFVIYKTIVFQTFKIRCFAKIVNG